MTISTRLVATALASSLLTVTPAIAQHRSSGGRGHSSSGGGGQARSGGAVVRSAPRPVAGGGRVYAQSRGGYGVRGSAGAVAQRGGYGYRGGYGGYYARSAPVRFYQPYYAFRPRFSIGFGLWAGYPVAYSAGFYAPYYYPYYDPYYYGYPYPYPYPYPDPYYYPYGGPAYGAPQTPYPQTPYPQAPYPPNAYPGSPTPLPPGSTTPPGTTTPPGSATPRTYPPSYVPRSNPNTPSSRSVTLDVQRDMGGFSFEVSPSSAQIFVDGKYMGTVGEFTPESQPLGVQAGHRHVELVADGYRAIQFDADVTAGQVLPYQGAMQR
jgi:hypothetical protein